jgi:hypothetical protein
MIRGGDADAIAGFRDAHEDLVTAFCAAFCTPERVGEAVDAAFLEFVARVRAGAGTDDEPVQGLLLNATRAAAAGRALIAPFDSARPSHSDPRLCAAMPELIAAAANGELRGDPTDLAREQAACVTCAATAARMRDADQAFALAPGPGDG